MSSARLTLAASNFEQIVKFYKDFLQQEPQALLPNVYAEFQLQGLRLGIFRPAAENEAEFAEPAGSGLSLCLEVVDLEAAIALLADLGYPPPGPIQTPSHGREIYAYDPLGNRIILYEPRRSR